MKTTIDKAGRVVVPKALRSALGLSEGREIDIELVDDHLEISLPYVITEVAEGPDGLPYLVVPPQAPELTMDDVRGVIESVRR